MGRHSKRSKTKTVIHRTGATAALAGATLGGLAFAGVGTANAFPGQAGLVRCESGGNPTAVNNTAAGQAAGRPAGLFQIVTKTWLANGGGQFAPTADRAAAWQQQIVADRIYAKQGSAPWQCKTGAGPAQFANFSGGRTAGISSATAAVTKPVTSAATAAPAAHVTRAAAPSQPAAAPAAPKGGYTVVAGDTLSGIAQKFGVAGGWKHLQQMNRIPNADLIQIGQQIAM